MKLDIVGVIGDIHEEDIFLEKTVAYLRSQYIQNILCVGDIVDGGHDINLQNKMKSQSNKLLICKTNKTTKNSVKTELNL